MHNDFHESICKICNYIACPKNNPEIKCLKCSSSGNLYHEKCLKPFQLNIGCQEKEWRSPSYVRCTNCKSQLGKETLMVCRISNSPYHYNCLPLSYKQTLKPLYQT